MTPVRGSLRVFDTLDELTEGAAAFMLERATGATGPFRVALAGGSTPKPLYARMARPPVREAFPWERAEWVLGDERFVRHSDPASNFGMIGATMLSHVPAPAERIFPVPYDGLSPEQAAAEYEATLMRLYGSDRLDPARPLLDVNLLGMGDDGHIASLLPGQPVLDVQDRWVVAVEHGRTEPRITLTYPALESSRVTIFLVAGEGKRAILEHVLSGGSDVPAGRMRPQGELFWFIDRAAAGRWAD